MRMNCHVFIDFDGTLAPGDPTDTLLAKFADPSWLDLEAEFKAGRMTSRECMARQFGLLRASPEATKPPSAACRSTLRFQNSLSFAVAMTSR